MWDVYTKISVGGRMDESLFPDWQFGKKSSELVRRIHRGRLSIWILCFDLSPLSYAAEEMETLFMLQFYL